jgi:hypothetical protein
VVGFGPALVLAYRSGAIGDPRLLWDLSFGILGLSGVPTALAPITMFLWLLAASVSLLLAPPAEPSPASPARRASA